MPPQVVESLNILPAHLSHIPKRDRRGPRFADGLKRFVQAVYCPVLETALRWRYLTASIGVGVMIVTIGLVLSGRPFFRFMPSIEAAVISASVTMPQGTPVATTGEAVGKLEAGAARLRQRLLEETGRDYFVHVLAAVGDQPMAGRGGGPDGPPVGSSSSSNVGEVAIELLPTEQRIYGSEQLDLMWRDATGPIPEAVDVNFTLSIMNPGSDVDVQLGGPNLDRLRAAAEDVKQRLREYAGVYEVTDSFRARQMKLGIKPAAENLGLDAAGPRAAGALGVLRRGGAAHPARPRRHPRHGPLSARRASRSATSRTCTSAPPMAARCRSTKVAVVEPGRGFASIRRIETRP